MLRGAADSYTVPYLNADILSDPDANVCSWHSYADADPNVSSHGYPDANGYPISYAGAQLPVLGACGGYVRQADGGREGRPFGV